MKSVFFGRGDTTIVLHEHFTLKLLSAKTERRFNARLSSTCFVFTFNVSLHLIHLHLQHTCKQHILAKLLKSTHTAPCLTPHPHSPVAGASSRARQVSWRRLLSSGSLERVALSSGTMAEMGLKLSAAPDKLQTR
ncbi:hypothetical protein ILYODFUR_011626 [Ilyodon furcidens]|uniref:Uncharacterized protein n=1 Tax=Ilyodon furcidens TaxID=33524 RepID=A0ABV0U4K3_9TELE